VDPGPQDHQHIAVPLRSQELERAPDVLRRFRPAAAWRTTTAQDPQSYAPQRGQGAVAKAQGPGVEAGGPPVRRRRGRLSWERWVAGSNPVAQLDFNRDWPQRLRSNCGRITPLTHAANIRTRFSSLTRAPSIAYTRTPGSCSSTRASAATHRRPSPGHTYSDLSEKNTASWGMGRAAAHPGGSQ
jgi:hypothetical protein